MITRLSTCIFLHDTAKTAASLNVPVAAANMLGTFTSACGTSKLLDTWPYTTRSPCTSFEFSNSNSSKVRFSGPGYSFKYPDDSTLATAWVRSVLCWHCTNRSATTLQSQSSRARLGLSPYACPCSFYPSCLCHCPFHHSCIHLPVSNCHSI